MREFTQEELYEALDGYIENQEKLLAQAREAVVEWKYANDEMFANYPLSEEIGFRDYNKWDRAKRRWYKKEPNTRSWYKVGLDADGNVRVAENHTGKLVTFAIYTDGLIDEFRSWYGEGNLKRWIVEDGVTQAGYDCSIYPRQYEREVFHRENGRCVKSVVEGAFLSRRSDQWEDSSAQTFTYEYDDEGLLKVIEIDCDEELYPGGTQLLYTRPKPKPKRKKGDPKPRRPIVAYTYPYFEPDDADDPYYDVRSDAYGLEMNADDEWKIDAILLPAPQWVEAVTDATDVMSMGIKLGSCAMPEDGDLKKLKKAKAKWLVVDGASPDAKSHAQDALAAKLNVILSINDNEQLGALDGIDVGKPDALAVAFREDELPDAKAAQERAAAIRAELGKRNLADSRVVMACPLHIEGKVLIGNSNAMDYVGQPDIDGILVLDGTFDHVVNIMSIVADNSK